MIDPAPTMLLHGHSEQCNRASSCECIISLGGQEFVLVLNYAGADHVIMYPSFDMLWSLGSRGQAWEIDLIK